MKQTAVLRAMPIGILGLALVAALSSCSESTVKEVPHYKPNKIMIYDNAKDQPALVRICIDKVAFVTTENKDVILVPQWDDWCKTSSQ
jgi:hypothetical protein